MSRSKSSHKSMWVRRGFQIGQLLFHGGLSETNKSLRQNAPKRKRSVSVALQLTILTNRPASIHPEPMPDFHADALSGEHFEASVRQVARHLYRGAAATGSIILDGRERDEIIDTGTELIVIEATKERKKE
ncbi:hypothetical protein KRR38_29765 [Novosphingobium sp. G106]|uniref:hypothetical protein n=1 Tax=Novosphingobium sp. G106 TaxID=2849500 RepID=UPI001C2D5C65|nr:hypothetical protein [Novosphingobium sp. G106]MBV1691753.1 hypothetical protein [Novosphingobium sp. G106]